MKKQLCTLAVLASMFIGTEAFGQSEKGRVGVNTPTPKATLDIQNLSSNLTTNEGLLIPRLTKTRVASIDNNQLVKGTLVFVDNVSYSGNNPKVRQINEEGFYYYNGDIWTRSAGPAGANGKTILSGTSNPTNQGTDGDFYINTTTNTLFGPKTGSNWGSGKSLIGPKGANGNNGASMLTGNGVPQAATGANGDSYVDTATGTLYKKNNGSWATIGSIKGATGQQGPQGVAGPKGATGQQGPQGVAGPKGANGNNGASMLTGNGVPQAATGANGDSYVDTATGTLYKKNNGSWANIGSIKGATGQQGSQGVAGPKGANGNNGASMLTGNGVPQAATGANGDSYVDTATGTLYKKNNGSWATIGSIKGATGQQGPQGVAGPKGANGNNGASMLTGNGVPQAATGANGDSYVDTATGTLYKKNNGSWATIGSIKGATGQQGPQGVAGPKGATGQQGPQGPAGPQGGIGLIGNGTNTTVTGNGTTANPYKINTSTGNITGTGITVGNGNGAALKGVTLSIADNAINSAKIQNETIESVDIKNGAIKGEDIANATITADKLAANVLQNIYTHDGTITQNRKVTTGNNALTIEGTAYHPLQISTHNSNGNGGLSIRPKGDNDKRIEFNATPEGNLRLWAARDVIYALRSNGNVGIGTNSPVDKLQVAGNVLSIGGLRSSVNAADGVGGYVELINDAKTGAVLSKRWRIYNMQSKGTNKYADGLHFWGYAEDGTNLGSKAILTDDGKLNIGFGSSVSSNASATQKLNVKGNVLISDLAGAGDRIVLADANGILKTGSVSASTLSGTGNITGTGITVGNGNGAVLKNVTLSIADNAINSAKIQNGTVESVDIKDGTIVNADIANNTITGGKIANATITADKLAANVLQNIYTHDGTITQNRKVTTGNNALTIEGTAYHPLQINANSSNGNGGLVIRPMGDTEKRIELNTTPEGNLRLWAARDVIYALRSNGNIGIGTNNPIAKLDVAGGIRAKQGIPNGDATNLGYAFGQDGDTGIFSKANAQNTNIAENLSLYVNNVERIHIKENGNVGIGTNTPTAKLDVTGNVKSTALAGTGDRNVVASADGTLKIGTPSTPIREVTGATTIAVTDNGGFVYVNATGAVNVTVPSTLPAGFSCVIIQQGTGQVRLVGQGVTLQSARGTKTRTKFSAVGVIKRTDANVTITGDAIN